MKKIFLMVAALMIFGLECPANAFHIEVIQVADIPQFTYAYHGFLDELEKNGIKQGENLVINRHIVDANANAGLWQKIWILRNIKKTTTEIIDSKPDLVLTIGTPATKHSKDKFIDAHIPVVFTAVAVPGAIGCKSNTVSGPGFTGATLYLDPLVVLKIAQLAFPDLKTMGIVHSDDDNAIAFSEDTKEKAPSLGIEVFTEEVNKSDSMIPAAKKLMDKGINAFGIPIDTYYSLNDGKAAADLMTVSQKAGIPGISFVISTSDTAASIKGAVLYIGADFHLIGDFSGTQAVKILKDGAKPGDLPVLRQEDLLIQVDLDAAEKLGIKLPLSILKLAEKV
ncbi:MAG: ABC transporter substrate binding protein [Thermodesulfobacteriota bacterium]|nr:ABC transporter substrate binding protein [Thermodesulfobacteriota bacterium]